jgi:hypothetical protein
MVRRPASAVVTLALALASDVARGCVFCADDGWSYDLSALSTETFVVHDGIPTENNEPYAYLVTSPCGSVSTDTCIAGPTSDPIAMPNVQTITPGLCVWAWERSTRRMLQWRWWAEAIPV